MSNILEVTFESGQTFATATRLWKGDYGQILLIHGPELPSYYEVHFASTKDGTPEVSVGTPSGVQIPNRLLQAEGYIYAWVFLHVGANDGATKFQVKIPVEERGIPVDQETPADQTAVQQAIAALNAETGRAEAAADAAEVSEQNAKASEDAARASEQNAETAAQAAAASAENAAISETGAAESEAAAAASAQQAATSAEAAAQYAASAGGSEELVEEYARRAKGSADTAELYGTMAVNAKDAAEASARSATQASQAAVSAKNIAETAAQTATQKASEASSSAGVASSQASMAAAEAAAASGYANNAEGSARQAAASAEDAADSADDADDSAASARLHDEQAQAAKVDAQTAAGNASAAQTAAEAAQTAAETAQGKAEDAQTAAETAQGLAEAAQTAAEAAQYIAEDAQDAAESAAQSISQSAAQIEQNTEDITQLKSQIDDLDAIVTGLTDEKKTYMKSAPVVPLIVENCADFAWGSSIYAAALNQKNVVLTINATAGEEEFTATSVSPDTLSYSDFGDTGWIAGLLCTDGETFTPCNFGLIEGSTFKIYPPIEEDITNGTVSTLWYDAGRTYAGMHLTDNGYKAYAQHLWNTNPKHCEVGKYIARFRPDKNDPCPFVWYGGQIGPSAYRYTVVNRNYGYLGRPTKKAYEFAFSHQYTPHTTKSGAYWEQALGGKSGYLEAFVWAQAKNFKLPADQVFYLSVTIDGETKLSMVLDNTLCRRIVVDFENATTGRIEIYSNKWAGIDGAAYGIGLGRVTWWVNELRYEENERLLPIGLPLGMEFDSWGSYSEGAVQKELERLQRKEMSVTVPVWNHSLANQTSAWGKAYLFENIVQYHPQLAILDFLINDKNSVSAPAIPATITGPDGVEYNNKITQQDYIDNMTCISELLRKSMIQPIFMGVTQHGPTDYNEFTNALIDAIAEQVT